LTRVAIETPGRRVLNIADPLAPSVADIAAFIANHLDYDGRIVGVDEQSGTPMVGRTPWSVPRPFVLDCRAAVELGYSPAATYADAAKPVCDWLVETAGDGDWKDRLPFLAKYPRDLFDYVAEDEFFAA
jgi:nucleoside-diphosphate-sugar epimerase